MTAAEPYFVRYPRRYVACLLAVFAMNAIIFTGSMILFERRVFTEEFELMRIYGAAGLFLFAGVALAVLEFWPLRPRQEAVEKIASEKSQRATWVWSSAGLTAMVCGIALFTFPDFLSQQPAQGILQTSFPLIALMHKRRAERYEKLLDQMPNPRPSIRQDRR